jgi:hypothetical protein
MQADTLLSIFGLFLPMWLKLRYYPDIKVVTSS